AAPVAPQDKLRLDDGVTAPPQFKKYIDGTAHRAHVIGDPVLACRIDSTAVDYRYPAASGGTTTTMNAVILRDDVEQRCRDLVHTLGLGRAVTDLKLHLHRPPR